MSKLIHSTLEKICLPEKGSIISGPFGSNISSKYFVASGIPVIRGNNLSLTYDKFYDDGFVFVTPEKAEELKCYAIRGDLIFTAAGTLGQVGIIPQNSIYDTYVISNKQIRARLDSGKIDLLYAFYWFSSPWIQKILKNNNKGSTVPLLTLAEVKSLPIVYPESLEEQRRIAKCIDEFSLKIENNNVINDNLAQQAKLLYDYWFTQFDFPDENNKPYRSSGGKMEWNDRIKRNIPTGWHVVTFTNIATWESNSQPPKSEFRYEPQDGYVRFIQNRDYDSNAHKTYIPLTKNLSIVDRLDILMDKYGDAGAVRYGIEGAFNVALGKINVHNTSHREYIRSYLESDGIYTYLHNSCMASTRASLSESNLANLILVMPDDVTIAKYEAILNNIRKRILKNNDEIEKLVELRDWFLPLLMNGQATIAE